MLAALISLTLMASAPAPQISCEISMKSWCIVQLPSVVEMKDRGNTREWTIKTNQDVSKAEISISENKFCDGPLNPILHRSLDHDTFLISSDQSCGLRIVVSKHNANVKPEALIEDIIMLRDGARWVSPHR